VISSAAEEEDSSLFMKGIDENASTNDRSLVHRLVKDFPDPLNYIIGFHCSPLSYEQPTASSTDPEPTRQPT
jgi:hypothetical protein